MMRSYFFLLTILFFSLGIASCAPSREAADKRLAKTCAATIKILSDPADQIDVQKTSFKFEKGNNDASLRTVMLDTHFIHDHGVMVEKSYSCSYKEQWSMTGYLPEFYVLEKDGQKIGNVNGTLTGDTNDLIKINDATEKMF